MPPHTTTPTAAELERWREHLQHEWAVADALRALAAHSKHPAEAEALERLASREAGHAQHWITHLQAAGAAVPAPRPGLRDRLLRTLAARVPAHDLLPIMHADAVQGVQAYQADAAAAPLIHSERVVARTTGTLSNRGPAAMATERGREHRRSTAGNGSLRAAVFGVNDGLVSNLSLVMGVAGATADSQWILLTGMAGLLAGAFSMGGGEFILMLSQRELFERELAVERLEIQKDPERERANLARLYEEKGLAPEQANAVATQLMADPDVALDTIAREQLGLDPNELGSPRAAALSSLLSFTVGALIPILPFVVLHSLAAISVSLALSAVGLFIVGALLSLFTGRSAAVSGLRMLGIGLGAAALTYGIGRLLGVSVAG